MVYSVKKDLQRNLLNNETYKKNSFQAAASNES